MVLKEVLKLVNLSITKKIFTKKFQLFHFMEKIKNHPKKILKMLMF